MDISDRISIRWTFIGEIHVVFASRRNIRCECAGEREPRGLDFAKTRGWKAARRADCSRREENNANNGRDVALRWARAYAANTITLWTRLPFKWKQTWNAKIHRRARPRDARNAQVPLPPFDHRYANCARALYTECSTLFEKYFTHGFFDECKIEFFLSNNILLN